METRTIEIYVEINEDGDRTDANAVTEVRGREFSGWGRAKRNPADPQVPMIGEELALARALADMSDQLLDVAAETIAAREGHEALLRS